MNVAMQWEWDIENPSDQFAYRGLSANTLDR